MAGTLGQLVNGWHLKETVTGSCGITSCDSRTAVCTRGRFCPQGTSGDVWVHFWVSEIGGRSCYWHLVGRGQGYCSASASAQDGPTTESDLARDTSGASTGEPSSKLEQSSSIPKGCPGKHVYGLGVDLA